MNPLTNQIASSIHHSKHPSAESIVKIFKLEDDSLRFPYSGEPLFSLLIEQGLLDTNFTLGENSEKLIQHLFTKRNLDTQICLIDLIGLEIHDTLGEIFGQRGMEDAKKLQNEFSSVCFLMYCHLIRSSRWPKKSTNKNKDLFTHKFNALKEKITNAVNRRQSEIQANPKLSPGLKNNQKSKLNKELQELLACIDLFINICPSPEGKKILFDYNLNVFSGSSSLEKQTPPNWKDFKKYAEDFKKYTAYIGDLFAFTKNQGYSTFNYSNQFQELNLWIQDFLEETNLDKIPFFQNWFLDFSTYINDRSAINLLCFETIRKDPLEQNESIKEILKEESDAWEEDLLTEDCIYEFLKIVIDDIRRICENRILFARFPTKFLPNERLENRVTLNGSIISKLSLSELHQDDILRDPVFSIIKEKVQSLFGPLLKTAQATNFVQTFSQTRFVDPQKIHLEDENTPLSKRIFPFDRNFLKEFDPLLQAMNDLDKTLPTHLQNLIQELQSSLMNNSLDSLNTPEAIKDILLQEMVPFFPLWILLKDIERLNGTISPLISEELADFITLEGFTIPEKKQNSVISVAQYAKSTSSSITQPKVSKKNKKSFPVKEILNTKAEKDNFEPLIEPILKSNNVRYIEKELIRLGFIQMHQKGSHGTFKQKDPITQLPSGPIVVVPLGSGSKELPLGTFKKVEGMIQKAINSNNAKKYSKI
jgi:predicted RNA binding protein YcfA (HicA-like mRNA interferase family)